MKTYILLIILSVSVLHVTAQTTSQLDVNNINATVNTIYNPLFHNATTGSPGFEAPKGSGIHSIFASNLWIGGLDEINQLHVAANTYGGENDFIPGPIMYSQHYSSQVPLWNKVWHIEKADVINHIANYNQPDYLLPLAFMEWPAHGDTDLGQAANLAPFYDHDENGIYNPLLGDYPLVPGDECVFYIFNDDTNHALSGGTAIGVEIQAFVYAFDCESDSALQNTIFVKYHITNRGSALTNTSIGIFNDLDLGGYSDDYMQCNVEKGAFYSFAGDSFDESTSGNAGYGNALAAQAIVFLGGPNKDADGIDNPLTQNIADALSNSGIPYPALGLYYGDGYPDNERLGLSGFSIYFNGPMGFPQNSLDYYYSLTGKWLDGSPLVFGGSGHSASAGAIENGLLETTYMYPGNNDPLNWGTGGVSPVTVDWSETALANPSGERSSIGWSGPFTLNTNATHELDLAYVFARDQINLNDPTASVSILNNRIDAARNYFIEQQTPCGDFGIVTSINEIENDVILSVFPNPSTNQFSIHIQKEQDNLLYSVHDVLGKVVSQGKMSSTIMTIDCANWDKGLYLIKVGELNNYTTAKLLVQ